MCCICGHRIKFSGKDHKCILLAKAKEVFNQQYSNQDSDINDPKYPKSLCTSSRLSLSGIHEGSNKRRIPEMPNYSDLLLSRPTRSRDEEDSCNCYKGRGCKKATVLIDRNNGLIGAASTSSNSKQELKMLIA